MSHQGCWAVPWGLGSPQSGEVVAAKRGGLCALVWEGVTAARHVSGITGVFGERAWEEPVVARHVVPMTWGMAGETVQDKFSYISKLVPESALC